MLSKPGAQPMKRLNTIEVHNLPSLRYFFEVFLNTKLKQTHSCRFNMNRKSKAKTKRELLIFFYLRVAMSPLQWRIQNFFWGELGYFLKKP